MTDDPTVTRPEVPRRRVLVLGDSWVRGLGDGSGTLAQLMPAELGAGEVLDLSRISRVTPDVVRDHLDAIRAFDPDVAFLAIGGADSLIFPAPFLQRLIDRFFPPKWQGVEGLMPLARYSRDRRKRIRQRIEIAAKTLLKQVMVTLFGAHRRVPLDDFADAAQVVLQTLAGMGTLSVMVGFTRVDPFTSPRTNASLRRTNAELRRLAAVTPGALYVDTAGLVRVWDDYLSDRVHLGRDGHRRIADAVVAALASAGDPWRGLVAAVHPVPSHPAVPGELAG